ncbi:MAG TPA: hypothetical protein VEI74_14825 [Candidatus Methylomirabilis sp.]|nr:hypothetical protein [Candidatus Methylomirabilis sp.]
MTDDGTDKPGLGKPERRKKVRRVNTDRRERVRWELDNPLRRKNPGRRAYDRLPYLPDPKK